MNWIMAEQIGYEPITTFWDDFTIADAFGMDAVLDTYKRAFREWKDKCSYLTELVMVLNHKRWQWFEVDDSLANLYNDLFEKTDEYAMENLKCEELTYYLRTTD